MRFNWLKSNATEFKAGEHCPPATCVYQIALWKKGWGMRGTNLQKWDIPGVVFSPIPALDPLKLSPAWAVMRPTPYSAFRAIP